MSRVMEAIDAVSGKEGMVYLTINGSTYEYAELLKFKSKVEYRKSEVKRLRARMDGSKVTGAKGIGEMSVHYHRPEMRAMALDYLRTGRSPIFDAMVVNDDPTSAAGKQTTLVKNIVPDESLIAELDADSEETLKDEFAFTFDDFDFLSQFTAIN